MTRQPFLGILLAIVAATDAKDQTVADFYARFGFEATPTEPLTLFMPIGTVRRVADS